MVKRKSFTKKTRFEVFKRDSFQCQYCGAKSPDVVLEVDHINPVAKGGKNDLMNLITSCFDCNRGKSDRGISDSSVVNKQMKQMEELNERRNQLEMMLSWRNEMISLDEKQLSVLEEDINRRLKVVCISDYFKNELKKLLKKYGLEKMLDSIDLSASQYLKDVQNKSHRDNFLNKISGIARNISLPAIDQKINYMSGYVSKSFGVPYWKVKQEISLYCEVLRNCWGYSDDAIILDLENDLNSLFKRAGSWAVFSGAIDAWINDITTKK